MKYIDILLENKLLTLYLIVLFLFIITGPYVGFIKKNLADWHWLQTRDKIEQSGIAIVKQCEKRRLAASHYYLIELVEQNDEFSIKYKQYDNDRTCLDEKKVYSILEDIPLNTAIPISWVTRKSGEPILMSINGQTDIDNNSPDSIIVPLLLIVGLFVVPIGLILTGFVLFRLVFGSDETE